jgi:hypothetical protein
MKEVADESKFSTVFSFSEPCNANNSHAESDTLEYNFPDIDLNTPSYQTYTNLYCISGHVVRKVDN